MAADREHIWQACFNNPYTNDHSSFNKNEVNG